MLDGNYSVLRMLLFRNTTNVFRNHLQQCVQKSFTTMCSEIVYNKVFRNHHYIVFMNYRFDVFILLPHLCSLM